MPLDGDVTFGPYRVDLRGHRLLHDDVPVVMQLRPFELLLYFVEHAGEVLTKEQIIDAVWRGTAVSDASLTQAVFHLRTALDPDHPSRFIETVARIGYRFVAPVARAVVRHSDDELDALVEPYRHFMDGRAGIETLSLERVTAACVVCQRLVQRHPLEARFHTGLAMASAFIFDSTRADQVQNVEALRRAVLHADEACRLNPRLAEAWSTRGFVLARTPDTAGALAAHAQSMALEPDNWRHLLRYAQTAWGQERLTLARRVIELAPDVAAPWWLGASVFVGRGVHDEAERHLDQGIGVMHAGERASERFAMLGLHWMKGMLLGNRGDTGGALDLFAAELARVANGHIYGREAEANTLSATGACHHLRNERDAARVAYHGSLARVPGHPISTAGLARLDEAALVFPADTRQTFDHAVAHAIDLVGRGNVDRAVDLVLDAVVASPPGPTGWRVALEPLLQVNANRDRWARVLSLVSNRAM